MSSLSGGATQPIGFLQGFFGTSDMFQAPLIVRVRNALAKVVDPTTGRSIVADGFVSGLTVSKDGVVRFAVESTERDRAEGLADRARRAAEDVKGVARVVAVATVPTAAPSRTPAPPPVAPGHDNPLGLRKQERIAAETLPGVKRVIAVASGKGGVGKSTLAANLAVAFGRMGLRTGLLDADIYGPSLPVLFGLSEKPPLVDGKIQPVEKYGVRSMSIGLLVDPQKALAWRGPM
ncbi:MAG: Mrp/NBP35 family ATP-binding protein, partial [Parvularculaceae bacterium]|nr:Mrp/NBP35 family ATP-binding protein [Parvularculaceae bacterium]